jgi:tyrosine-protein kinase Etk/Wzc
MEEIEKIEPKLPNQEIDYFKIGKILLSRWYWIAGSIITCFILANLYLWYTAKIYATNGTLKLEEKKSEISEIMPTSLYPDRSVSKVQSETVVLQSSPLLTNAVRHLDYRLSYFIKGRFFNRTADVYPEKPFKVELIQFDSLNFYRGYITFKPIDREKFSIAYTVANIKIEKNYKYGEPFTVAQATTLVIESALGVSRNSIYELRINTAEDLARKARSGMRVAEVAKFSNIISVQETSANPIFASDLVNAILTEYLSYDVEQKRLSASQTIQFIDDQLKTLAVEVQSSQNAIKSYKEGKKMVDVSTSASEALSEAKDLEAQRSILNVQLIAIDELKKDIVDEKDNLNVSFNLNGVIESQLTYFLSALDGLIKEKKALLKTYSPGSQVIQSSNQQIIETKTSALRSLGSSRELIESKIKYLEEQLIPVNERIAALPAEERDLVNLKRDFDINEKVYTLLSEKKLDAQITRAGILPGATIVDTAKPNFKAVSPDEESVNRLALIIGAAIGFSLIFVIRILNPFIYDKETIESLTTIPIIGVIRKYPGKIDEYSSQILALVKPKSVFAESIRSVRANLNFLASEKSSKVICITSEVAGEGKSFVAVNLSSTLSLINKKVILISADLRRSKLHKTFLVPNDLGLSNYLANQCSKEDIINTNQNNLDFIISGPVPPNPAELIQSERMMKLIAELKLEYDFIMIDTAPIGLVSDALPIIRTSDINLFVIRSGKSKYYAATIPQRISLEYHLDNTVIVLNAYAEDILHSRYYNTKFTGGSYSGGKYYYYSDYTGYESSGYYTDKENENIKWWDIRKWFK